jgi:putative endonuclease
VGWRGRSPLARQCAEPTAMRQSAAASRCPSIALLFSRCQTMEAMKQPCGYIMANKRNGTLYTGVTSAIAQRAWQHREGIYNGFTRRYGCKLLVWYEPHHTMLTAIEREKQIKTGSRKAKLTLIEAMNPQWRDLYEDRNK